MFSYDDIKEDPPCPVVKLRITDLKRNSVFEFEAIVDTGSDATCMPRYITAGNTNFNYEPCGVDDIEAGKRIPGVMVRITRASVEFLDRNDVVRYQGLYDDLRLLVRAEGILGRDVLNMHLSKFSGLNLQWFIGDDQRVGAQQP